MQAHLLRSAGLQDLLEVQMVSGADSGVGGLGTSRNQERRVMPSQSLWSEDQVQFRACHHLPVCTAISVVL